MEGGQPASHAPHSARSCDTLAGVPPASFGRQICFRGGPIGGAPGHRARLRGRIGGGGAPDGVVPDLGG